MPDAKMIADFKRSGKADSVLLISSSCNVVAEGTSGRGFGVWAVIETSKGLVGYTSYTCPWEEAEKGRAEQEAASTATTRQEVLQLINKRLTREQNRKMRCMPDEELNEKTVKGLPKEKSPGIDGVVIEILIMGWQFMQDDCRDIIENVLSLRLAQEWTYVLGQETVFVKLDFQKAYDRVSHQFLWDTLAAVDMEADNVAMIRGIVEGADRRFT
ncbi:hypothetical protein R1sor_006382 [Riccia sorocarpa]|uniref:Reverse transcriptase domain-containing protein n=1 Tax=Riccia sorocarpa TaxID=122646 RepID=A0ABD3HP66_9MARC